ncbi:hypothetical protein D3C81_1208480 [compost metagenome]
MLVLRNVFQVSGDQIDAGKRRHGGIGRMVGRARIQVHVEGQLVEVDALGRRHLLPDFFEYRCRSRVGFSDFCQHHFTFFDKPQLLVQVRDDPLATVGIQTGDGRLDPQVHGRHEAVQKFGAFYAESLQFLLE